MTKKKTDFSHFEQSIAELEQIVQQLEQGDLSLDQALHQFERGIELSRTSQQQLQAALEEEKARGRVAEEEWRSFTDGKAPELGLRRPQLAGALATAPRGVLALATATGVRFSGAMLPKSVSCGVLARTLGSTCKALP